MPDRTTRILDVGQCNMDHGNISRMLSERYGAQVDRAHFADQALAAAKRARYDLVLVNRIFDSDGDEGLEFIRRFREDAALAATPVMLVSNHADAQASAADIGAIPGFGKAALDAPATHALLAAVLSGAPSERSNP